MQENSKSYYKVQKDNGYLKPVNKRLQFWKNTLYILISSFIYATSFHYFVTPCSFAPGGIGGVLAMIQHIFKSTGNGELDFSTWLIVMLNIPLLIPAYKMLSKNFAIKTFICTLFISIFMFILANFIDPDFKFTIVGTPLVTDVGTRFISAILAGALCGVSLAFALKANCSTGGADIVGAILQKKRPQVSVPNMIFMVNGVILIVSIFVYREMLMPVFLSIFYIYTTSIVCDMILQGSKAALKFEVITEHANEIANDIIENLGHGVTVVPAKGMFEQRDKTLLICIIKPRQIAKFQSIISRYPETFAYVGHVNEIIGKFRY